MFGKTFGVEFEIIAPSSASRASIAAALTAAGVSAYDAGYTHAVSRSWKVVSDGSVAAEAGQPGHGMELVSPVLEGDAGMAAVRKVCEVLTRLECRVNKSCGLHVHVGARNMAVQAMRKLAIHYSDFEDVIDGMMPVSRRSNNNTYIRSVKGFSKARMETASDVRAIAGLVAQGAPDYSSRYRKLNFTSHWKHGTVEFRHHAGTVNADKACNWVKACLRMVRAAERNGSSPVAVAGGNRPRSAALAKIYDLCARAEGCSREEARVALGRTSPPRMSRLTEDAGVALRIVGQRYFLAEMPVVNSAAAAPAAEVISVDGWCTALEMPEDEKAFWQARHAFFAQAAATAADVVGWQPGTVMARRAGA